MKKVGQFVSLIFFMLSFNLYSQNEVLSSSSVVSPPSNFLYSVIISSQDWYSETLQKCKLKISSLLEDARRKNLNAIVFVVRKDGYVVYKSSFSQTIPFVKNLSGEDLVRFVIDEARKYNLKFFVLMDIFKTTKDVNLSWLCKTEGKKVYTPLWLSCGNPEVHVYLRNIVKEFLSFYPDIDGIIFDNLCYPDENTSYDDVSLYRFYTRGNPKLLEYDDFQREQLNKFVSDIYTEIKRININIMVGSFVSAEYRTPSSLTGGYYKHYQDTKKWVENNYCDFVIPKLSLKNFNLVKEFTKTVPKSKVILHISGNFNEEEIKNFYSNQYLGVLLSNIPKSTLLTNQPDFIPIKLNLNCITGIVYDEMLKPLSDAWVSMSNSSGTDLDFTLTSADGYFSFVTVATQPVNLQICYPYAEEVTISSITFDQQPEIKFISSTMSASTERTKLFFYIHQPKNFLQYTKDTIHFLGRTYPEYKVTLFTDEVSTSVKVYSTGMFAVDNIKLKLGENKIIFVISDNKQNKITQQEFIINYTTPVPAQITEIKKEFNLLLPEENDILLFSGDVLEIKLTATEKKKIYAVWSENLPKVLLDETSPGVYEKRYLTPANIFSPKTKLYFEIEEKQPILLWKKKIVRKVEPERDVYIELWNSAYPLVAETVAEKTPMTYGLHYVRLGGPYITELPKGIKLQIIGKQQDKYKVKLSASLSGWVDQQNVTILKNFAKPIHNFFTYCSISAEKNMDKIWVPWVQQVPFSVTPVVEDNKNYVVIDFFNTHLAVTWLTYKSQAKILDNFKASQVEDDHVQLKIPVKTKQLWGFNVEPSTAGITIYVKYPPKINKEKPLAGITIALEAGHGGDTNTGAIGLSGSKEKNINLRLVSILKSKLEQHGAKVVLMRVGDTNPDFKQRIQTAVDGKADIMVSIHGNAGSTERGFLRVSGTSMYYKYDNSKLLSECIYQELLALWKDDFGLVGNFNYTPLRQTLIPATLVEQGFLTHPYDEARMLDKNFTVLQAEAILKGIKKFLLLVAE